MGKKYMNNKHVLAEENIGKLLFQLSLPATTGMLVMALYNIVDTIYVGRGVGPLAIAGLSIVFPIQMMVMAIGQLLGIGSGSVISRSLGEGGIDKANRVLGTTMTATMIIATLLTVVGLVFTEEILAVFGVTEAIYPYAKDYFQIIIFASILFITSMSSNNILRSEGQAKAAMKTMITGAVINIILDPIFIFVFHMGVKGAALATVISQLCAVIYIFLFFASGKTILKVQVRYLRINLSILKEVVVIGMSSFLRNVAASVMFALVNNSLGNYGGDMAIAAYGIIQRVLRFIVMPIIGIAQGMQPIVGFNYGALRFNKVQEVMRIAIISATFAVTFGMVMIQLFGPFFMRLFSDDAELVALGAHAMRLMTMAYPVIGFQIVSTTVFQALGKARESLVLSLSREIIFLIPLVMVLPRFMGLTGLWYSFPIADFLASLLTLMFFMRLMRQLADLQPQPVRT